MREMDETRQITGLIKSKAISDDQLKQLQLDIICGLGKTIASTGGLKKIRMAGDNTGKRGGWRVIFADYPEYEYTALVYAYQKADKDNLTNADEKAFRKFKKGLDRKVEKKYGKKKQ
jgi:hypothetical protein